MKRNSPCLHCDHKRVDDNYNCHMECKEYKDFSEYRTMINDNRRVYQKERTYESMSKLKKVGRPNK